MRNKIVLLFLLSASFFTKTYGHEIRPIYLGITQTHDHTYEVIWKIPSSGNRIPSIHPEFPEGFLLKEKGRQVLPDALILSYSATYNETLSGKTITAKGLAMSLMDVWVNISLLDGQQYAIMLQPDQPSASIPLIPSVWSTLYLYTRLGIEHILIGFDHLLFVLGLLLLIQRVSLLVKTITAFTLAHSITLGLAALNIFHLPQAPVEAVIALSIVFLAREYIRFQQGEDSFTQNYPWVVALAFGLLHGFGFAGALSEIGFPQKDVPLALFSFNLGVEMGQLLFIAAVLAARGLALRMGTRLGPKVKLFAAYLMGIIAAYWTIERIFGFWE